MPFEKYLPQVMSPEFQKMSCLLQSMELEKLNNRKTVCVRHTLLNFLEIIFLLCAEYLSA